MKISFIVPGNPQGKARPRVCRINGKSITYTPKKTVEYEKLIRASYSSVSKVKFEKNTPLEIDILAFFSLPKSSTKKFKNDAVIGRFLPCKKPDCDNIIKVIFDALNGVAYYDDSQICKVYFEKRYDDNPCVHVEIKDVLEEK